MAVVNMTVGATTDGGATFAVKPDTGPVRVLVADNAAMSGGTFFGPEALDANGRAKVAATGLDPHTRYWWQVEDNGVLDTSTTGQFVTLPVEGSQATFTVGFATCAGSMPTATGVGSVLASDRVSNHTVFDTIRSRALSEGWLGFWHGGDLHYYDLGSGDHGISGGASLANYLRAYDDVLLQPNQARLYREVPWWHVWDDHDFGPDDSDRTHTGRGNASDAYRSAVPHYTLTDPDGIWQAWQIGRVLFIASDVRYYRDPNTDPDGPSKTMLGAAQKTWMQDLLDTSTAAALCWFMPDQWLRTDTPTDTWGAFATERAELVDMLTGTTNQHGRVWADVMWMGNGDRHALGLDRGSQPFGGFPVLLAASLDSSFGSPMSGVFDTGDDQPGRGHYGTITVTDLGSIISVRLAGWQGTTLWRDHTFAMEVGTPQFAVASAQVVEFAEVTGGSHEPVFEARVLTSFQSGDDPTGEVIPILGGDVAFDGTADVFATLELATAGVDEDTGQSLFPRLPGDLLAPYGNEIWVRRGIDRGDAILWSPLGFFRIDDAEQADSPYGEIAISGQDRMAGIIDARLVVARSFPPSTTVAGVFAALVGEVYPAAVIVFDDDTGFADVGRTVTVEEKRYEALAEIAQSFGKIMYWDGEGILRVESTPDESVPLWEVKAGADGVLVSASRRVSREGMRNGWVYTGEGGDDQESVRAIVVDVGPQSPTKWGGRFGKVPGFHSSPFIRTEAQAEDAARARLRRNLGAPHSASFGAVVNPALRPHHPVRVTQRDANREIHVMQAVTVPLTADGEMSGETRERTHVLIGRVTS